MPKYIFIFLLLVSNAFAGDAILIQDYKLTYSGEIDYNHGGTPTMVIKFDDAVGATYTTEVGGFVFDVIATPYRFPDPTYPAGLSGTRGYSWYFGAADRIELTDANGADSLSPTGNFSLLAIVSTITTNASNSTIMGRWDSLGVAQRVFYLYRYSTSIYFKVTKDGTEAGGSVSTVSKSGSYILRERPICIGATYDGSGGDGHAIMTIYPDDDTPAQITNGVAPPWSTGVNSDFTFSSKDGGGDKFLGRFHYAAYWDGVVLTASDYEFLCAQWRGAMAGGGRGFIQSTTSPPAYRLTPLTGTSHPFLIESFVAQAGSPNGTGSGGIYSSRNMTNLVQRGSFETWSGGDASGWVEAVTGSATISGTANFRAHEAYAAYQNHVLATDDSSLTSVCMDIDPAKAYALNFWARKVGGTVNYTYTITSYSDSGCTADATVEVTNNLGDLTTSLTKYTDSIAAGNWAGTAQYATVKFSNDNVSDDVLLDAVQFLEDCTYATDAGCYCDTDATCSCAYSDYEMNQPLALNGTWTIKATIRSPIDGAVATPLRQILYSAKTDGANENQIDFYWASDVLTLSIYDNSDVQHTATVACAKANDVDVDVLARKTSSGRIQVCCDAVCGAVGTDAFMDDIASTLDLGNDGTDGGEIWIRNLKFYRDWRN